MGVKISELQEKTTANDTDVIPIVDDGTKKITKANLLKEINNQITNANTYATEEINTGEKWIDGKDIYRKVIVVKDLSTVSRISDNTIALGESLDTAWCDGGFCYYTSNKYQYPLDSNVGVTIQISAANNNLRILNDNINQRTMDFYVIVKYTKV